MLFNKIEGKITECWVVNKEGIFFFILLEKRAKLLAHDWFSGCLATAYAIEKLLLKISVTMASRFEIVDEEYIEELKDKSEDENTRNWKHGVLEERFQKVANERNFQANLGGFESDVLDQTLSCCRFMQSYEKKTVMTSPTAWK